IRIQHHGRVVQTGQTDHTGSHFLYRHEGWKHEPVRLADMVGSEALWNLERRLLSGFPPSDRLLSRSPTSTGRSHSIGTCWESGYFSRYPTWAFSIAAASA